MQPTAILLCYIALAALDLAWAVFLTLLNYRTVARNADRVPEPFRASVAPAEHAKASAYSRAGMRLSLVEGPIMAAITIAAVALGLFGLLDAAVGSLARAEYWRGALFLGALGLASSLAAAPWSLYSTFVLERRFGFNTTSLGTWILDALKGWALAAALGLPLLFLLYAFMDRAGGLWWLWAAVAFSCLRLLLSFLYPLLIAPLFNKFAPLPEGELARRIRNLAGDLGFRMSGIFVMDGSRRSRHSNAYFTGLGRAKRIVLYDTLVSSMTEDEVLAVLAHEIGHEKMRHTLKATAVSIVLSFFGFWVLARLMGWRELYSAFGFASASKHAMLLILGLVSGPATFFLTPIFSAWSRRHERAADDFAARALPAGAGALSSALIRLNRENASNLAPHPLYSSWYYSHPTLGERLAALAQTTPEM